MSNESPSLLDACKACDKAITAITEATEPAPVHWANLGAVRHLLRMAIQGVSVEPTLETEQQAAFSRWWHKTTQINCGITFRLQNRVDRETAKIIWNAAKEETP